MFQSTPALVGRALAVRPDLELLWDCFNPRPPLWDGRSRQRKRPGRCAVVSIHARPCGTGAP